MDTTETYREALRAATATVGDLARECGYTRNLFDRYLNRRPPSHAAVRALADALDARGERLHEHAERLRAVLRQEAEG